MGNTDNNKIIEILQHDISYCYANNQDMPEHEIEHVQQMIIGGYNQGDLSDGTETKENRGWWEIV